jgi:phosphoglycolate phosphatase-like HAD superfamily hydrolase
MLDTAVFDVDGTLVDSTYHHLLAWSRAFAAVGVVVPCWRLHAHMGMGGDQLVAAVSGDSVEQEVGDEVRERWRIAYDELLSEVAPVPGAAATLTTFKQAGLEVVLATSGDPSHLERTLDILELGRHDYPIVTSADVEATKPAGDLVRRALDVVGGRSGVVVGDTSWDVEAASRARTPAICVLTGGVSASRLTSAGALNVYDDVAAIGRSVRDVVGLDESRPLRRAVGAT